MGVDLNIGRLGDNSLPYPSIGDNGDAAEAPAPVVKPYKLSAELQLSRNSNFSGL